MRVLDLHSDWVHKCREASTLLSLYGDDGTRYQDSRISTMMEDSTVPPPGIDQLLRLLRSIDEVYAEDMAWRAASPAVSTSSLGVRRRRSYQVTQKAKRRRLSVNPYIDIAAIESSEENAEDEEEQEDEETIPAGPSHRPQSVGPSGKQSYQQKIDTIIERLDYRAPDKTSIANLPEMSQLPEGITLPPKSSIFELEFYTGTLLFFYRRFVFSYYPFLM